jgi:hypothetical protein
MSAARINKGQLSHDRAIYPKYVDIHLAREWLSFARLNMASFVGLQLLKGALRSLLLHQRIFFQLTFHECVFADYLLNDLWDILLWAITRLREKIPSWRLDRILQSCSCLNGCERKWVICPKVIKMGYVVWRKLRNVIFELMLFVLFRTMLGIKGSKRRKWIAFLARRF